MPLRGNHWSVRMSAMAKCGFNMQVFDVAY